MKKGTIEYHVSAVRSISGELLSRCRYRIDGNDIEDVFNPELPDSDFAERLEQQHLMLLRQCPHILKYESIVVEQL